MKNILCVILLMTCVGAMCQPSKKQDANKIFEDNFKKYSHKIDSAHKADFQKYKAKSDSLHNAQYLNQLERAILVDTAKDTYYGTVFSGIAVSVTVVILFFGFNVWQSRKEAKRQLKEIATNANISLVAQQKIHIDAYENLRTTAITFHQQIQDDLQERLSVAEEKVKVAETKSDDTSKQTLENARNEIERLKLRIKMGKEVPPQDSNNLKGTFSIAPGVGEILLTCSNRKCGKTFDCRSMNATLRSFNSESGYPVIKIVCPHCGTPNDIPKGVHRIIFNS